jgi:hypothetical protein
MIELKQLSGLMALNAVFALATAAPNRHGLINNTPQ